jgi:HJR/Mrr/RecB family endonuclease|tara:strand:- start:36 stop:263 length:228 start_codon:yes stop_codon:yes gene_type:complete
MAHRIGLDVKWYTDKVTRTVVRDEIEDALNNDCDALVILCKNGWTSAAEKKADECEDIDVYLIYPPDDMRELEDY